MRRIILCLFVLGIASCATRSTVCAVDRNVQRAAKTERFSGHWSVGPAYSWFTPYGANKRYWVDVKEIPKAVRDRLNSQSMHPTYSDGPEVSLYLIVDGYINPESAASSLSQLHIQQVVSVNDPNKDFVKQRKIPSS